MADPRQLDIIPFCGLKIKIKDPNRIIIDHTHVSSEWKYQITNLHEIFAVCAMSPRQENVEGWLSPTHSLTLPPKVKVAAGIPQEATSYAFMYPPEGLPEFFHNIRQSCDSDDIFLDNIAKESVELEAIKSALLLGGFAYFSDKFKFICINALSRKPSKQKLAFAGPFNVQSHVYVELHKMGRTHSLRLDTFREVGFESFAWVRPNEKIKFRPISMDYDICHGALVFFREDRTAVAYAVDHSKYVNPKGDVCFISDAISNIGKAEFTYKFKVIPPIYKKIETWKKIFQQSLVPVDTSKLIEMLEDKKTLLHMACHAVLGIKFIADVLSNTSEKSHLSYQNSFGWNPLHYACRFSPSDSALIKLLVDAYPDAVLQPDLYGRYPLHIACDSDTSIDVVNILLMADTSSPKVTILRKTHTFGYLPIHLACYKGAPNTIIEALLNADWHGLTVITTTKNGQLPLHLAILKQLPVNMVKILLDAASKVQNSYEYEDNADIHQTFEDKLPLHLACWNNSSSEIIEMLLDKDKNNITIREPFGLIHQSNIQSTHLSLDDAPFKRSSTKGYFTSMETVALHLAMKHGCKDVISLLLQKETEEENYEVGTSTLYMRDTRGRTPIHIACEYTIDAQIIQLLIELDSLKETIQINDAQGYRPMHYACEIENTSTEIINILCDAEENYIKTNPVKAKKRSTHAGDNERKRTPLFLAVKTGAPAAVIERLLQPENFTTKGFDEPAMEDLAEVIKNNEAIQDQVVRILGRRRYFGIIMIDLYANIIAQVSFWIGSIQLRNGTLHRTWPSLLVFSALLFLSREILQVLSVGADYIRDVYSYIEILSIIFSLVTAITMLDKIDDPEPKLDTNVLSITAFLLTLVTIFFLRSSFLPFAKLLSGVIWITWELIPFLIVLFFVIFSFVYSFYVIGEKYCDTISACYSMVFTNFLNYAGRINEGVSLIRIIFGVMMVIVLLNVVIAIVSEAWSTAGKQSTKLFWKYRVEKIAELKYTDKFVGGHTRLSDTRLMRYIDNIGTISYANDISWSKAPYHFVTKKDQYDKPSEYFSSDIATEIIKVKSLQNDLYWAKMNAKYHDVRFTYSDRIALILKWLGKCILYVLFIIMGIFTCGFFFPRNFRHGVLSVGHNETVTTPVNTQMVEKPHKD